MIARLRVQLPYLFFVDAPDGLPLREFPFRSYVVRTYPPLRSNGPLAQPTATPRAIDRPSPATPQPRTSEVTFDGLPTTPADLLQFDLLKADFDRSANTTDPSEEDIHYLTNLFIEQLRALTRSGHLKPLQRESVSWALEYLRDDGSPLDPQPPLIRGRWAMAFRMQDAAAIPREIWDAMCSLPPDFRASTPDQLLLDAVSLLPDVGPAIVLANTAIEVSISTALDRLADGGAIDENLWRWINDRDGDYRKEPSLKERLTVLMKALGGHSLSDDQKLWMSFNQLRDARNSFAHEGIAKLDKRRTTVSPAKAAELIGAAEGIIGWIEARLPEEARRPRVNVKTIIQRSQELGTVAPPAEPSSGVSSEKREPT